MNINSSDWPIYLKDKLIIGNLESNVGVATLWMPKESVSAELDPNSYSVCAQLYTKRGFNPMFRNILANPLIRYLVICGVDRQGSGDALVKFFENGVNPESGKSGELRGWKVVGDEEALIDKEITIEALDQIRRHVTLIDLRMKPLTEVRSRVVGLEKLPPFGDPQYFEETKVPSMSKFPSDISVYKVRRDLIGEAWLDVLKIVNRFGTEVSGMYGGVKEVHNLSVVIDKEDSDTPQIPEYMKFRTDGLHLYIKGFMDKNPGTEAYTYGERIFDFNGIDQAQIMVEKLTRYPYDRGAIAMLWNPQKDNYPPSGEPVSQQGQTKGWKVPCLVMILGQCIDNNFHMTAVFRNNDMYGAWPLNAFALRSLQKQISLKIGKNLGSLTTISHIAEIYEMDWDDSSKIVSEFDSLARTCMYDSRGYYIVNVEGEDVVVTFFTPDGSAQLAEFRMNGNQPKVARDLCAMSIKDMLISDLGAAADLGRQLAKAENAVKLGLIFTQDQPLKFK